LRGAVLVEKDLLGVEHRVIVGLVGFEFGRSASGSLVIDFTEEVSSFLWITARIKVLLAPSSQSANMCIPLRLKGWILLLLAATAVLRLVEHAIFGDVRVPVGPEAA
jgi:hypothetical protein